MRWSDALIADAAGIADYYRREFDAPTTLLTYGAPLIDAGVRPAGRARPRAAAATTSSWPASSRRTTSTSSSTATAAARPRKPLVVVGSAPYSDEYTARVHAAGRRPGPLPRRGLGPGAARPAVRATATPTCTATRSAAPTPRCCAPSAPARRCSPSTSTSTARSSPRPGATSAAPADVAALVDAAEAEPRRTGPPDGARPRAGRRLRLGRRRRRVRGAGAAASPRRDFPSRRPSGRARCTRRRPVTAAACPEPPTAEPAGVERRPTPRRSIRCPRSAAATAATVPVDETLRETLRRLAGAQKGAEGAPAYSRFVNRKLGRLLAAAGLPRRADPERGHRHQRRVHRHRHRAARARGRPSWAWASRVAACLVLGYALRRRRRAAGPAARRRVAGRGVARPHGRRGRRPRACTWPCSSASTASRRSSAGRCCWCRSGYCVVDAVIYFGTMLNEALRAQHGVADPGPARPASGRACCARCSSCRPTTACCAASSCSRRAGAVLLRLHLPLRRGGGLPRCSPPSSGSARSAGCPDDAVPGRLDRRHRPPRRRPVRPARPPLVVAAWSSPLVAWCSRRSRRRRTPGRRRPATPTATGAAASTDGAATGPALGARAADAAADRADRRTPTELPPSLPAGRRSTSRPPSATASPATLAVDRGRSRARRRGPGNIAGPALRVTVRIDQRDRRRRCPSTASRSTWPTAPS